MYLQGFTRIILESCKLQRLDRYTAFVARLRARALISKVIYLHMDTLCTIFFLSTFVLRAAHPFRLSFSIIRWFALRIRLYVCVSRA